MKLGSNMRSSASSLPAPGRRQTLARLARLGGLPLLGSAPALLLGGCVSMELGGDPPQALQWALHDPATPPVSPPGSPQVPALLLQAQAADALLDSTAMAYSPRAGAFAAYQYASWTERPARQLQRLLQRRLLDAGVAGAVAALGEPLRADWLLSIKLEALHHATQSLPGTGRVALVAALYDRRSRRQPAQRRFEVEVAAPTGDAVGAVQALSLALGQVFDAMLPWLRVELQRAMAEGAAG